MMKIFMLYFDTEYGSREEWNIFYTPCELFSSEEDRAVRMKFLKTAVDEDGEPFNYKFHLTDSVVMSKDQLTQKVQ